MITTGKTAFVYGGKTANSTKVPVTVIYSDDKEKTGLHVNLIIYIMLIIIM